MNVKRIVSFILSTVLCCSSASQFNTSYHTPVYAENVASETINDEENLIPYEYDENQTFAYDSILVVLKRSYSGLNKSWDITDFSVSNTLSIDDLTYMDISEEKQKEYLEKTDFHQILKVSLKEQSFEAVISAINAFESCEAVLAVQPNYHFKECSVPNDPIIPSNYYGFSNVDLYDAWDTETGSSSVKVGIIDSGIANVTDLNGNVDYSLGYDFYNNNTLTSDDTSGHGTKVASVVGAIGNNLAGVCGVCWDVSLIPLQINGNVVSSWVQAITYAETLDIPIVNLSYSIFGSQPALANAVNNYNGLFVCSAGNDSIDLDNYSPKYPVSLSCDNLIAVAASTSNDSLAYFSNYGATIVDLAAPGSYIWVANTSGGYEQASGTSFAAPMVAGTAALLLSYNPNLTTLELKEAILNTVDHVNSYEGKLLTEGRLNVSRALQYVKTPNQVQNIVVQVKKTNANILSSFNFDIWYKKNYQNYSGIVNGSAIPSGYSVTYSPISYDKQWDMHISYSGANITNTGELFTCRFKSNVNEAYYSFDNSINITNPNYLPYIIAVLGDINEDGIVDNTDTTAVQQYLLHLITFNERQLIAADVNFDGTISMSDAITIAMYKDRNIDSFF